MGEEFTTQNLISKLRGRSLKRAREVVGVKKRGPRGPKPKKIKRVSKIIKWDTFS